MGDGYSVSAVRHALNQVVAACREMGLGFLRLGPVLFRDLGITWTRLSDRRLPSHHQVQPSQSFSTSVLRVEAEVRSTP